MTARIVYFILVSLLTFSCKDTFAQKKSFSVFQLNIWHEGTVLPKGYTAIIEEIIDKDADIVLLSEVNNRDGVDFVSKLLKDLKVKGQTYYGISNEPTLDVATISYSRAKYAI